MSLSSRRCRVAAEASCGTVPVKNDVWRSSTVRAGRGATAASRPELNAFADRSTVVKAVQLPSDRGAGPVNRLFVRFSTLRDGHRGRKAASGRVPTSPTLPNCSDVTTPPVQVTPKRPVHKAVGVPFAAAAQPDSAAGVGGGGGTAAHKAPRAPHPPASPVHAHVAPAGAAARVNRSGVSARAQDRQRWPKGVVSAVMVTGGNLTPSSPGAGRCSSGRHTGRRLGACRGQKHGGAALGGCPSVERYKMGATRATSSILMIKIIVPFGVSPPPPPAC